MVGAHPTLIKKVWPGNEWAFSTTRFLPPSQTDKTTTFIAKTVFCSNVIVHN